MIVRTSVKATSEVLITYKRVYMIAHTKRLITTPKIHQNSDDLDGCTTLQWSKYSYIGSKIPKNRPFWTKNDSFWTQVG